MDKMYQTGKLLTVGAISATVACVLMINYASAAMLSEKPTLSTGLGLVLIIAVCVELYHGATWARWILGLGLSLIGFIWLLQFISSTPKHLNLFLIVWNGAALALLGFGTALLAANPVKSFLAHQRANLSPVTSRILKISRLVAGLSLTFALAIDAVKLLR